MPRQARIDVQGPRQRLCSGHPPPAAGMLSLGETIVDLTAAGQPAKFNVYVEAVDLVSGESLKVSAPLEVVQL